jgi:protein involved in polysaccharide export with SLBB domain
MTARDLVFKAGGLTKDAHLPVAHLYRTDPATKAVTIHVFDLGGALTGDPDANLVLQDLDHVVIHSAYDFAPVQRISASGMVNRPGDYPYAGNMRVRDLVLAAGGLTEEAYVAEAEVVRTELLAGETGETRTLPFDLAAAMAGDPAANFPLQPYDRLFVKKIPEWKRARQVTLEGEVTFPGAYHVAKGERLSSVLRRAGGYTAEAYLRGAVFTRESARRQQQQRLNELRDRLQEAVFRASSQEVQAALSPEDVAIQQHFLASQQALLQKLVSIQASGRVVIQLLPLRELEGTEWDVILEDGDSLAVPERPQTVAVVGQVYNPTSLLWEPDNRRAGYYLQRTGGPTPDAEEKRMYVVRADGTVVSSEGEGGTNWWTRGGIRSLDLYPGDTVLVPERLLRVSYLKEFRDISQILYQIAIAAGVAVAIF